MYRSGQMSESCPFQVLKLRGFDFQQHQLEKKTQIILSWQHLFSALQIFLFQLSPPLSCLDLCLFQQNNSVNQGPTIFPASLEEQRTESHAAPPITVSATCQFLQLAEPSEGRLVNTTTSASPLTLGMYLSIFPALGTLTACHTWPSKSCFVHLSHGIYASLRATNKGAEFLTFAHQVITSWITSLIVITQKGNTQQHWKWDYLTLPELHFFFNQRMTFN